MEAHSPGARLASDMKYIRTLVEYSSLRLEDRIRMGLEESFDDFSVIKVIEDGGTLPGIRGLGET